MTGIVFPPDMAVGDGEAVPTLVAHGGELASDLRQPINPSFLPKIFVNGYRAVIRQYDNLPSIPGGFPYLTDEEEFQNEPLAQALDADRVARWNGLYKGWNEEYSAAEPKAKRKIYRNIKEAVEQEGGSDRTRYEKCGKLLASRKEREQDSTSNPTAGK